MNTEYEYLISLLKSGDIERLEEASLVIEDFPDGMDSFLHRHWISNAIDCGCLTTIQWILQKGVNLSFEPDDGYTALLSALDREEDDRYIVIELLIKHGAPINQRGINDWTPLHKAAVDEDIHALELLIKNGAALEIRTRIDDYATPLEEARILGRKKAVAFLEQFA